ncbi:MAG TPA: Gfo/Idh/MocA family oxidoreductase [Acetobacteraceae bacterium]|jgi:predicted dehydrogenase|nr:Gfo/Idh/MocA family oxidoreductase [Acetobacteraceae bacterium]
MIRAGIVGLGWWGKRLLEAARPASDRIQFVHAVSPRPELRRDVADAHGLLLSSSIAAMLDDPAVEAVVLATPHSMHADQIVEVARGGKPILCEKPFTLTRADAVRGVAACEQAGVLLALGHNRRFLPALAELKRLIADGTLGRLLHVEGHISNQNSSNNFAAWRHDADESPAGGLTGTGVHMLDCFVNLLGPVRRVTAQLLTWQGPPESLDSLSVLLEFRNGMSGTLATVRVTPVTWRLHVFGTEGNAENHDQTGLVLRLSGKPVERRSLPEVDTLCLELEAFADAVERRVPYPVPYDQMIDTVAVFEAITRSVAAGGRTTEVETC